MLRLLIIIFAVSSYLFSQNENRRDKFISLHVGEPIYLSFSMDLFKQHRIKLYSGLGTLDLIGYQDYSKKYIDMNKYFYRSRSIILINNTYLQNTFFSFWRNRLNMHFNTGCQTRFIYDFVYYTRITQPNHLQTFDVPSKTLIELLPFLQLGLSYTSPNRRYIYGANVGIAKTVFPIVWKLEPLADVYIGMNLRGGKNRNRLN